LGCLPKRHERQRDKGKKRRWYIFLVGLQHLIYGNKEMPKTCKRYWFGPPPINQSARRPIRSWDVLCHLYEQRYSKPPSVPLYCFGFLLWPLPRIFNNVGWSTTRCGCSRKRFPEFPAGLSSGYNLVWHAVQPHTYRAWHYECIVVHIWTPSNALIKGPTFSSLN
jgi:hypothetical protein